MLGPQSLILGGHSHPNSQWQASPRPRYPSPAPLPPPPCILGDWCESTHLSSLFGMVMGSLWALGAGCGQEGL